MAEPLILLDRDGVLNSMVVDPDHGTIDSPLAPAQVEVFPWVPEALGRLTEAGYNLAIVTNQPAWAKGKTTRANLDAVHDAVLTKATSAGGRIASSHICYHRAEDNCDCRKPRPGLLRAALEQNRSAVSPPAWMVGDGLTDIQAGAALGLNTAYLGPQKADARHAMAQLDVAPSFWGTDLLAFTKHVLGADAAKQPALKHSLGVKIFADGANVATIRALARDPGICGFTTNPTLMRQSGIRDYAAFGREALQAVPDKPISFEVLADTVPEIERQALLIHSWGPNVYVKVPITTTDGTPLVGLVHKLSRAGVKVNVTAVFTLPQVQAAAEALRGTPAVISVFAGRIADSGRDPVATMQSALRICRAADPRIELLWASPRELLNVVQADEIGVDIITLTDALYNKLHLLGKDLLEFSRETVLMFKRDGDSAGFTL